MNRTSDAELTEMIGLYGSWADNAAREALARGRELREAKKRIVELEYEKDRFSAHCDEARKDRDHYRLLYYGPNCSCEEEQLERLKEDVIEQRDAARAELDEAQADIEVLREGREEMEENAGHTIGLLQANLAAERAERERLEGLLLRLVKPKPCNDRIASLEAENAEQAEEIERLKGLPSVDVRESLAELAHEQWSGWMRHLFSKSTINPDGTATLPAWGVERWQRQVNTPYAQLSDEEQNSDRKEADRVLAVIAPPTDWRGLVERLVDKLEQVDQTRDCDCGISAKAILAEARAKLEGTK